AVLQGSLDQIWGMEAVPGTDHVVTRVKDGTVARWKVATPRRPPNPRIVPGIRDVVSFAGPDGKMIVRKEGGSVALGDWSDPNQLREIELLDSYVRWAFWCPEKQLLAAFPFRTSGER
ncbi:MAG: hypothetical protein GWO24_19740, partial [Akkermansiaceae bacterium]|nr:hypothetical protein [Akkermansiaceae bacterium]